MSYRAERLAETIKKEFSAMLHNELRDPRLGFVTITRVVVSSDLSSAKIHVSIYGSADEQNATMEALSRAHGYIRSELGKRIRLRHTPEISFKLDTSVVQSIRVMELLKEINEGKEYTVND